MNGYISSKQEFLLPDSPLGQMAPALRLATGRNETLGIQILVGTEASIRVAVDSALVEVETYEMVPIPVEYNTGNGVDQGGAMVILKDTCPSYAVRKAPFRVYDCMKPQPTGVIPANRGVVAAYVTLQPRSSTAPGTYALSLTVECGGECHVCAITYVIYDVSFQEDQFQQTNWFNFTAMEQQHGIKRGTPEFYEVVRSYARSMRAVHQKVFLIWLHEDLAARHEKAPYDDRTNAPTEYTVNADMELCFRGKPLTVWQYRVDIRDGILEETPTDVAVPMHLFYRDSLFQVFPTNYLAMVYSDDGGESWSSVRLLSYLKPEDEKLLVTGPGIGIQICRGKWAGRLVVPVYSVTKTNLGVLYSDDGGDSWHYAPSDPPGEDTTGEPQLFELPDGSLGILYEKYDSWCREQLHSLDHMTFEALPIPNILGTAKP